MSVIDKYSSHVSPLPLFFPFSSSKKSHHSPCMPFDEALIARLKSLPSVSSSISLDWLRLAVNLLSRTLSDAAVLISDPSLSASDRSALASYLDASVALLDACNAISAEIERLLRGRLLIRFALHLLSSSSGKPLPTERIRRARDAIKEWEASPRRTISDSAGDLIRSLGPGDLPRGKSSAVLRAIYAVEAVSSLVAGAVLVVLGGMEKKDLASIRVSGDFPWAQAFNKVKTDISSNLGMRSACEVEAMEACVRRLAAVIDGEDSGEKTERLQSAVKEAEKATEELTDGLDRLSNAVNGLFHKALSARTTALQSFRIGPPNCK